MSFKLMLFWWISANERLKTIIFDKEVDTKCWLKLLILNVKAILYELTYTIVIDPLRSETSQ
jgi:hypothetical protein